jgi:hypothetical protein
MSQKPDETTGLDRAIADVLSQMDNVMTADSEEYEKMVARLTELHALKMNEKSQDASNSWKDVSKETWVTVGAHIAGIVMIVGYERGHLMTSKALGFIKSLR